MKCINCGKLLTPVNAGGVTVDMCTQGCGGMWFDMLELKRFDEPGEGAGEELLRFEPPHPVHIQHDRRLNCPKCEGMVMMRYFYSPRKQVEVDHCPNCGGYWLDAGELRAIRNEALTEDRREAEIEILLKQEFGAELESLAATREQALSHPSLLRRMFGFLVPASQQTLGEPNRLDRQE